MLVTGYWLWLLDTGGWLLATVRHVPAVHAKDVAHFRRVAALEVHDANLRHWSSRERGGTEVYWFLILATGSGGEECYWLLALVIGSGYWFWRTGGLLVTDSGLVLVTDYMILARAGLGHGEDAGEGPGHKKEGGRGAQARQRPPMDSVTFGGG